MIDKSRVAGPLASYAAGFGAELARLWAMRPGR